MRLAALLSLLVSVVSVAGAGSARAAEGMPPVPSVVSVSPSGGHTGATKLVTIAGSGFTGATSVLFAGRPATVLGISDTAITALAPRLDAIGSVKVQVVGPGGTSADHDQARFRYAESPVVTAVDPNTGPLSGGAEVVIFGTDLTFPETIVFFGDTPANVISNINDRLTVRSPPRGAGVVDVTVITPAGQSAPSSRARFTYDGGRWAAGPTSTQARYLHTATPLGDGRVLMAGGSTDYRSGSDGTALASAEIYDPVTNSFAPTGPLNSARFDHTASLLADGRVLVAGGRGDIGPDPNRSVEITGPDETNHLLIVPDLAGPTVRATMSAEPAGATLLAPGADITYAVSYYNTGDTPAPAVVTMWLPWEVDFRSGSAGVTYDEASRFVSYDAGEVGAGTTAGRPAGTFGVSVEIRTTRADTDKALVPGTSVELRAYVDGRRTSIVRHPVELTARNRGAAVRSATSSDPPAGATIVRTQQISYTVALFNDGLAARSGYVHTAEIRRSDPVEFVSASDGATYNPATGLVRFPPVEVAAVTTPAGPARIFTYTVRVRPTTNIRGLASAELFDPATGRWTVTAPMAQARSAHTATVLGGPACGTPLKPTYCGRVLVAGGSVSDGVRAPTATAELYDPVAGLWTRTGDMDPACTIGAGCGRGNHTATMLGNGRVLVAGGNARFPLEPTAGVTTFNTSATMGTARSYIARNASIDRNLPGAAIFINETSEPPSLSLVRPGEEITYTIIYYNVGTEAPRQLDLKYRIHHDLEYLSNDAGGVFMADESRIHFSGLPAPPGTTAGNPAGRITVRARVRPVAPGISVDPTFDPSLSADITSSFVITDGVGTVLDATKLRRWPGPGSIPGSALRLDVTNSPSLLEPVAIGDKVTFTVRYFNNGAAPLHGAVARLNLNVGMEFLSAGHGGRYDPATREVVFPATTVAANTSVTAPAGEYTVEALISNVTHPVDTAEIYDPTTGSWSSAPPMNIARWDHTATTLGDGRVLVAGGVFQGELAPTRPVATDSAEIFDPSSGTWAPTGFAPRPHRGHDAVALEDGSVLISGGSSSFPESSVTVGSVDAAIFDPGNGRWRNAAAMGSARGIHSLTVLGGSPCLPTSKPAWCGKVLATGGAGTEALAANTPKARPDSEIYTPAPLPPVVSSVSPARGPSRGGTTVVITGSGMGEVGSVRFDGVESASVEVLSPTSVRAVAPPHASGPVDVVVARSGGVSTPARAAFTYEVSSAPGPVIDLSARNLASSGSSSSVELSFSAVNGDGAFGPAAGRYDIRQSRTPITDEATFAAAARLCDPVCEFGPSGVGESLSLEIGGLAGATRYHYAVRAVNPIGPGPLSNPASVATPTPAAKAAQAIDTGAGGRTSTDVGPTGTGLSSAPAAPAAPGTRLSVPAPSRSLGLAAPATPAAVPAPTPGSSNPLLGTPGDIGATSDDLIAPAERPGTGKGGGSPWRIALAWMAVIGVLGAAGAFVNTRLRR